MAKKIYTTNYVNIKPLRAKYPNATYYLLYGEREDGKSYTVKNECIDEYKHLKKKFVYIRRTHQQIVRRNMIKVFDDIQDVAKRELGSKIYFDPQQSFYIINEEGEREQIGYHTSLQDAMLVKSIPMVDVGIIIFDEFIDYSYMDNEMSMFLHTLSTICRPPNDDVKIFMLGNTISKDCPYFKLFGVDTTKIKQGEPYYIQHSLGVSAVVYHTPTKVSDLVTKKKHNKYIGFDDNDSVNMIMFGEWEYQHCITGKIDNIGWNCKRHLLPMYFTALGQVYEFTVNTDIQVPITFIRKVNTQNGKVSNLIKYNLTYDRSVVLISKDGYVPTVTKVNSLLPKSIVDKWNTILKCIEAGRVIFDDISTGGEFLNLLPKIQ